jgi:hypothetical protein
MNDSNTEPIRRGNATEHVDSQVDNPVNNPPAPKRLLVIGSQSWPWVTVIADEMLRWWVACDRPFVRLVVEGGPFGQNVLSIYNDSMFSHEIHRLDGAVRNPERKLRRVMTADPFDHIIVVRYGNDPYVEDWVDYLKILSQQLRDDGRPGFTTSLIQFDFVQ